MEAIILLGSFAAVCVLWYFLISKLDKWLAPLQSKDAVSYQIHEIKIGTSQPDSIPGITAALKKLSVQYPEFRCTLLLGQEQEITTALACGSVDIAILSDHTAIPSMRCQDIKINTQSVSIMDDTIDLKILEPVPAHQRLLWNDRTLTPYISELIRQFCRQ